jgi:putative hydrolase of the HAD superfamily
MELSVKGLIFDYGGTIDTNGHHWGVIIWDKYKEFNVPVGNDAFREAYVYTERKLGKEPVIRPDHSFYDVLKIKLCLQFDFLKQGNRDLANEIALSCYNDTKQTILRAKAVLDLLKEVYPMILVSNFYGNLRTVLNEFGLSNYFGAIIESAEVGIRKPDPAIYELGVKTLGFKNSETAITGDSYKNDIRPAGAIGCPSVWLKGKGWDNKDESIPPHPCIIKDFSELLRVFI